MKIIEDYNSAFPGIPAERFDNNYIINEPSNQDKPFTLRKLELTGFSGFALPHTFPEKAQSFADMAGHNGLLKNNCDAIILTESEHKKYIILCELKSSFSVNEISSARDQIVGSYVKLEGILSILQTYKPQDYNVIGLIASFAPTTEDLTILKTITDRRGPFIHSLYRDGHRMMPADRCAATFYPFQVPSIDVFHVSIPGRLSEYSIDINTVIGQL